MKGEPRSFVIGTRGSPLAVWQAEHVAARLRDRWPGLECCLERIRTTGDKILDVPLARVGGKALFVKEIEEALLSGRVDLAVHSMKDVPTELPAGLAIVAMPEREDPADVLISRTGARLAALPRGARVGTSSLRRQAQLLRHRPDLTIVGVAGKSGHPDPETRQRGPRCDHPGRRGSETAGSRPSGDGSAPARGPLAGGRARGVGDRGASVERGSGR